MEKLLYTIRVGIGPLTGGGFKRVFRTDYSGSLTRTKKEATKHLENLKGSKVTITTAGAEVCSKDRDNTGELSRWSNTKK